MKTALFIDGANIHAAARQAGYDLDYGRIIKSFTGVIRANYYTAIYADDNGWNNLRPLLDWLDYNGFTCVTKPSKTFEDKLTGLTKIKGNMDVEMAVDMMELAPYIDHAVLFSGDGDFTAAVKAVQRRGVHVTVVTTMTNIADELRRAADAFIDLSDNHNRLKFQKVRTDAKP